MATLDSTDKKTTLIDDERGMIALEASYEIEGLALLISKELDDSPEVELMAISGIAKRIKGLNSVIMSALGDPVENNQHLRKRMN